MKTLIAFIIILKLGVATAEHYIVLPNEPDFFSGTASSPIAGQDFYLWRRDSGCYTSDYTIEPETHVKVIENDVRIFFKAGLGGSTICVIAHHLQFIYKEPKSMV